MGNTIRARATFLRGDVEVTVVGLYTSGYGDVEIEEAHLPDGERVRLEKGAETTKAEQAVIDRACWMWQQFGPNAKGDPICDACSDTGVCFAETEDEHGCYECAQGSAYNHQRHVDAGYEHKVGPRDAYLADSVKRGRVDNREAA